MFLPSRLGRRVSPGRRSESYATLTRGIVGSVVCFLLFFFYNRTRSYLVVLLSKQSTEFLFLNKAHKIFMEERISDYLFFFFFCEAHSIYVK